MHTFLERDTDTTHAVDAPDACVQDWRTSGLPLSDSRVCWRGFARTLRTPPGYGPDVRSLAPHGLGRIDIARGGEPGDAVVSRASPASREGLA